MSQLRKSKSLPIHIVEQHHDVVPFIHRAIASRLLPYSGIPVVHLDSHPDMLIPINLQAETVFQPQSLYDSLSIENWLLPLTFAKHVNYIVWIKPPWAHQIETSKQSFLIGKCGVSGKIRLTSKENYFLTDGLFRPAHDLLESSSVTLQVVDLVPEKWSELGPSHETSATEKALQELEDLQVPSHSSETVEPGFTMEPQDRNPSGVTVQPEISSQPWVTGLQEMLQDKPYILDIDLDFFSTANPFKGLLKPKEEEALARLYHYPPVKEYSDEAVKSFTEKREKQINMLEDIFSQLDNKYTHEQFPLRDPHIHSMSLTQLTGRDDKDLNFLDAQQQNDLQFLCQNFLLLRHEREVTFQQIHDFGCTLDDTELPHHISSASQIRALHAALKRVVEHLSKPALVTIARSSLDGYCPVDVVDSLENDVLKLLQEVFGPLQVNKHYDD